MKKAIIILMCVIGIGLFAAGIANIILIHTSFFMLLITVFAGLALFSFLAFVIGGGWVLGVFALLVCIIFFSLSGTVSGPAESLYVVERNDRIELYSSWGMTKPFSGVEVYDLWKTFEIKTKGVMQTKGGEVCWNVSTTFSRVDYDEFFTLIRQAGGFEEWDAQVKEAFQRVVDERIAQFDEQEVLPSGFSFSFTNEQAKTLADLGAVPSGDITAKGMRIFIK